MPTVPVIDQTASGAQPFAAPGVAPVRNYASQQIQQSGATLQQVGGQERQLGQTIGDRVQGVVDDAKIKAAENVFAGTVQKAAYDPDAGYFRQKGKSAVDAFQPTQEAIVKAQSDGLNGLDNDIQKHVFQQITNQHILDIGKQMADYKHGQSVAWAAGESKARSDNYSILALNASASRYQVDENGDPTGDFAKYIGQMKNEVLSSAKLAGFEPDSAQAKAMLTESMTSLNHGIIAQLLDNHDAAGAKKWFDEQKEAGNLDMRNIEQLGSAVKAEYDQQFVTDTANNIAAKVLSGSGKTPVTLAMPVAGSSINVTAGIGDPRSGGRKHDGIDIAVPVGTNVMAPAGGKVIKVWNDDKFGGGLSVEMQMPNGYTAGFAHLSAANVHEGDTVQQGAQLGLSGKTGNATGPVLHYMMKDDKGQYVDPRQVSQPQPNVQNFADPSALQSALKELDGRNDIDSHQKKQIANTLQSMHEHQFTIQNQQQAAVFKAASEAFYSGGMSAAAIPASISLQLTAEQRQQFKDKQTEEVLKQYNQGQAFKNMGETDVVSDFYANPDQLTLANVEQARPNLSNSTYLSLVNRASEQEKNPKGVIEAQNVEDRIRHFAGPAGVNVDPKTTAAKATLNDLRYAISNDIDRIKRENNGKATAAQVDDAIKQQVIQHTTRTPQSLWTHFSRTADVTQFNFQAPPKINDVRTFPNGKTGKWDGTGWEQVSK